MYYVMSESGRLLMLTMSEEKSKSINGMSGECLENNKAILIPTGVQMITTPEIPTVIGKTLIIPPTVLKANERAFGENQVIDGSTLMNLYDLDRYEDLVKIDICM